MMMMILDAYTNANVSVYPNANASVVGSMDAYSNANASVHPNANAYSNQTPVYIQTQTPV